MNYGTCKGCIFEKSDCEERRTIKAAVIGLRITSIKWKCHRRQPAFTKGQPVTVTMIERGGSGDGGDSLHDFDAYVISMKGRRVHAYVPVANQFIEEPGDFDFHSNGFVTLSMDHIRPREGVEEPICDDCRKTHRLEGHADYCRHANAEQRQRHYGEMGSW